MTVHHDGLVVDWLGYATLRIEGEDSIVYLDPGRYGVLSGEWEPFQPRIAHPPARDYDARDGDLVCVSHIHHYDPDGIRRVARDDATLVVYEGVDVTDTDRDVEPPEELPYDVLRVDDEADLLVEDVPLWTVPAYNHADGPNLRRDGTPIHPQDFGCGFILSIDGTRVFWTGDTDLLDGHEAIDVSLFVPTIAQHITMNRHDAADLAEAMDPDLVVPMHYNTFPALASDDEAFADDLAERGVPVELDSDG